MIKLNGYCYNVRKMLVDYYKKTNKNFLEVWTCFYESGPTLKKIKIEPQLVVIGFYEDKSNIEKINFKALNCDNNIDWDRFISNTWFKHYNRTGAYISTNKEDCIKEYNKQVYNSIKSFLDLKAKIDESIKRNELDFINTDLIMETLKEG